MGRLKQNTDANRQTLHSFLLGTFFLSLYLSFTNEMDPCFNGRPAFTLIATITELKTQFYEKRSMSELNQKVNFFVHFL